MLIMRVMNRPITTQRGSGLSNLNQSSFVTIGVEAMLTPTPFLQ